MIVFGGGCSKRGKGDRLSMDKVPVAPMGPAKMVEVGPVVPVVPAEMVEVEGGVLPAASEVKEKRVGRFWVEKYEVTWGQWKEVKEWGDKKGYEMEEGTGGGEEHPVTEVNWHSVVKWCNARSEKEGLMPVYVVGGVVYRGGKKTPEVKAGTNGYRLPREGEWEWAARGGVKGRGYEYSGSDDLGEVGWYLGNSRGKKYAAKRTREVGRKQGNELGIYDMSGNVWEWCFDQWESRGRVLRGGSWYDDASSARVSHRTYTDPGDSDYGIGFRVVRSSVP